MSKRQIAQIEDRIAKWLRDPLRFKNKLAIKVIKIWQHLTRLIALKLAACRTAASSCCKHARTIILWPEWESNEEECSAHNWVNVCSCTLQLGYMFYIFRCQYELRRKNKKNVDEINIWGCECFETFFNQKSAKLLDIIIY